MAERIFVKVMGFSDVERHALNTVFRLSEQRETIYTLWMPDAPEAPRLALIDGQSYEATVELESPKNNDLEVIWIGAVAPANAFRAFDRPLSWSDVIKAMDELFAPTDPLDFDLGFGDGTAPDLAGPPSARALIASKDRDERLYLRAKLALAHITQADDAETLAQAVELSRANRYDLALVAFDLPDAPGWTTVKELGAVLDVSHMVVIKTKVTLPERLRARFHGIQALFNKPVHPGRLQRLLQRVP